MVTKVKGSVLADKNPYVVNGTSEIRSGSCLLTALRLPHRLEIQFQQTPLMAQMLQQLGLYSVILAPQIT